MSPPDESDDLAVVVVPEPPSLEGWFEFVDSAVVVVAMVVVVVAALVVVVVASEPEELLSPPSGLASGFISTGDDEPDSYASTGFVGETTISLPASEEPRSSEVVVTPDPGVLGTEEDGATTSTALGMATPGERGTPSWR